MDAHIKRNVRRRSPWSELHEAVSLSGCLTRAVFAGLVQCRHNEFPWLGTEDTDKHAQGPFIKWWSCRRDTNSQRCCTSRCVSESSHYSKTTRGCASYELKHAGRATCLKCLFLFWIVSDSVLFPDNVLLDSHLQCPDKNSLRKTINKSTNMSYSSCHSLASIRSSHWCVFKVVIGWSDDRH